MRLKRGHPVVGDPAAPSPPSGVTRSCPGSGPHVPRYATSPIRPRTQPSEPELWYATVAVDRSPGHNVGYPLCPYHCAWNPFTPNGRFAGCGMPGPTLLTHVAAAGAVDTGAASPRGAGPTASQLKASTAATSGGDLPAAPLRCEPGAARGQ